MIRAKEIEVRTESIARLMAEDAGKPQAFWELFLGDAYQLVYFGDPKILADYENRASMRSKFRAKQRRRRATA